MESILQEINKNSIALCDEEIRENNRILDSVVQIIIEKMKRNSPLFRAMFRRIFYGGSFYDGLKVAKPNEFDLDLLLHLPVSIQPTITTSNMKGFVYVQTKNLDAWLRTPEAVAYENFEHYLIDETRYLSTQKVLSWMERVVHRALNEFPAGIVQNQVGRFKIFVSKEGPAMTLHISGNGVQIDVDLVACFVFGSNDWPKNGFEPNPFPEKWPDFFIVPKRPKFPKRQYRPRRPFYDPSWRSEFVPPPRRRPPKKHPISHYWRLSFQEQERELIGNKEMLKPAVKLVKKLRDNLEHTDIASYYIKTVALHMVVEIKDDHFWRSSLSQVFMALLEKYQSCIARKNLPYFWNEHNDLIRGIDADRLDNINNRLKKVIRDLKNSPELIVKYFPLSR